MHGDALRRAFENHDGRSFALGFAAVVGGLQHRAGPVERNRFARHVVAAGTVGLLQVKGADAPHGFDHVGRHADGQGASANHHHLRHRGGQRQHQLEVAAFAGDCGRFYAAAKGIDFRADHVHANAASRQFGHLCGG